MEKEKNSMLLKIKQKLRFLWENTPRVAKVYFALAAVAFICRSLCKISTPFADFFVRYVAGGVRFLMTSVSNILPFSIAEIFILLIPIVFVFLVLVGVRVSKSRERSASFAILLVSILALIYFLFVFTYATGYQKSTIDKSFSFKANEVSVEDLSATADWLTSEAMALCDEELFADKGSLMPFSFAEMNEKLNASFTAVNKEYDMLFNYYTKAKPVIFSGAMSYTHTLGIYTFFTGEANINMSYPDYTTVFTAAHEMSHQRGIARENEANFLAFIVCINADDDYIRYAGYVNMLEYVLNALATADYELYAATLTGLPKPIRRELAAYSEIYRKYDKTPVGDISQTLNDTYLKSQGTEGRVSYGMVVDLAVSYYKENVEKLPK